MKIALIGAYGFTGTLISEELQKANLEFSAYGRSIEKLVALQPEYSVLKSITAIDLRKREDIQMIIAKSDLVINCAGPFTEESALMLSEMAKSGKVYLDITGEVGFVRASKERYHESAQKHKSLIIHGCAFESLIADLGTAYLSAQVGAIKSIDTFYQFDQLRASPGTKMTMKLSKYRDSLRVQNNAWGVSSFQDNQYQVTTHLNENQVAIPYPLPEIAYNYWNHKVESAGSYLVLGEKQAARLGNNTEVEGDSLETLDVIRLRKRKGPNAEERADQKSNLTIRVTDSNDRPYILLMQSTDMYLITAKAMVISVQVIIQNGWNLYGVRSPAQLFKGREEEVLAQLNVTLIKDSTFDIRRK